MHNNLTEELFEDLLSPAMEDINRKDYENAIVKLKRLVEMYDHETDKKHIEYHSLLNLSGNIALLINDLETAHSYFEQALGENPESYHACAGLGEVFYQSEMYDSAKTMYEWAVYHNNTSGTAVSGLMKVNEKLGLTPGDFSLKVESKKEDITEEFLIGISELLKSESYDEAVKLIENFESSAEGIELETDFVTAFYNIKGFVLFNLDNIDGAKECYETALNLNPDSSQACAGLADVMLRTGAIQAKIMYEWGVRNNSSNIRAAEGLEKVNLLLGFDPKHSSI